MKRGFVIRVRIISSIIILFALVLLIRLYFVQIVNGEELSLRADRQYVQPSQGLFDRGSIFFANGNGKLATLKTGFTLAINPSILEDPLDAYNRLSDITAIDRDTFFIRAGKIDDPYEEIAQKLNSYAAEQIDELGIYGVNVYRQRWRYYPGDSLAAQTIGFVGFDQYDKLSGVYGLERYYNDVLARDDNEVYVNFFAEIFSNINTTLFDARASRSGNVYISIDQSVELFLEQILKDLHEQWNSRLTGGIIIDPRTGEIYAMALYPSFDLNDFQNVENSRIFSNPIVESVYEMGSIMKPLTMAAGIDSGAVSIETTYFDRGFVLLDGERLSNFDGKGRGRVSMQEVLNQSLNTGAVFVMQQMGTDTFRDYFFSFEFGEETGIDLPNESAGLVSNLESPRTVEYATASFGQGIAMTPIAMVRALSALANGGELPTPHLAQKIRHKNGIVKSVNFPPNKQVLSPETTEEVTRMLVEVVDTALLGGSVKLDRYSIAAKTGTAQIAKTDERGYYDDRFLHSFFGYFPAYEARFLVFLYTIEPHGVRYASQTLTQPFMDIVQFLINNYEIPPDR